MIDPFSMTNLPGIYAIGDVFGAPMLAHKVEYDGVVCFESLEGLRPTPMHRRMIPACTYCEPQVALVGLAEQAVKAGNREVRVGRFSFFGNGKAIAMGDNQRLKKVIFDSKPVSSWAHI